MFYRARADEWENKTHDSGNYADRVAMKKLKRVPGTRYLVGDSKLRDKTHLLPTTAIFRKISTRYKKNEALYSF